VYVQRVIAGTSGSAGSLQALRYAAEMARCHNAVLVPLLAWLPPGGDAVDRRYPSAQLRAVWTQAAWERLWRSIELAIGGPPADIGFTPKVMRGEAGQMLTQLAAQPGDVLVIGAGRHGAARRLMACKASRYCVAHATCPVISVPPSPLAAEAHGLRGWVARRRLHPEDAHLHAAGA
jgi:nucleotide-binding universal stress UspA family protein